MNRYFIKLAYKGTEYHGWQIQPNAITVQEVLNNALSTILREEINLVGAGRTDAGVHASCFYAHFNTKKNKITDTDYLVFKLNTFLPRDIAVYKINPVKKKAHARFDATSRTYKYFFTTIKDPFKTEFSYYLYKKIDVNKMNEGCKVLYEYSDFSSFSKSKTQAKTNLCEIHDARWIERDHEIIFTIKANRFLRNMVRAIVGTMLDIGQEKLTIDDFRKVIESKNRSNAGYSIPANGLFLTDIEYPPEVFEK